MNRAKARGTAAESRLVNYLHEQGFTWVERRTLSGANDKGDIAGLPVAIEVKDHAKLNVPGWVQEAEDEGRNANALAGVAWYKKRGTTNPGEWIVAMKGSEFVKILLALGVSPHNPQQ